ncbi:hypothetical protein EUZ85_20230 [Hahella sp. KA22]|uniref:hypothetical protein n=1 Tax=Hahella sp. KA22 TaxID=1628392 RepID=UPI000FDD0DF1|nr:hypothetical protein [Hahella sp. KA22]AZZ92929.1 hypothetical protein ENC22_17650 [Hahella sp. KA22]QAY56303.1 hypothetical protein EUZ85_20230 [Hahella sp. KA22]
MNRVFVDTMVFRYASSVKVSTHAKKSEGYIIQPTGEKRSATFMMVNNDVIPSSERQDIQSELEAIKAISDLAKDGQLTLCYSHEVNLELCCQPLVDIAIGRFHGAPCEIVHSPLLKVGKTDFAKDDDNLYPLKIYPDQVRTISAFDIDSETSSEKLEEFMREALLRIPINSFLHHMDFKNTIAIVKEVSGYKTNAPVLLYSLLKMVPDKRYTAILQALNVREINEKNRPNTYLDALHLWTAEEAHCDFFMTTDKNILNQYKSHTVQALTPSQAIQALSQTQ